MVSLCTPIQHDSSNRTHQPLRMLVIASTRCQAQLVDATLPQVLYPDIPHWAYLSPSHLLTYRHVSKHAGKKPPGDFAGACVTRSPGMLAGRSGRDVASM